MPASDTRYFGCKPVRHGGKPVLRLVAKASSFVNAVGSVASLEWEWRMNVQLESLLGRKAL